MTTGTEGHRCTPPAPYAGWHLVAFAAELRDAVTPVDIGNRPLVAVREGADVRVFEATCPHRGAHLGYGGRLQHDHLVCPFHGRRVELGADRGCEYRVAEQPSLQVGDAVFVRLDDGPDHGFTAGMAGLAETHRVVAGFSTPIRTEATLVVENAFDPEHFGPVHGTWHVSDMAPALGESGELLVESELTVASGASWDEAATGVTRYRFFARAFSPNLVLTQLGGGDLDPYFLTGTTPTTEGCVARVAMAVPNRADGRSQPQEYVDALVAGAREAFREDIPVWEHLAPGHVPRLDHRDKAVIAFRDFAASFSR